ncbi:MAG: HAD family hydrolase [Sphingomonas sp.]|jgi:HAD superfamily hydrolase (TIGR01509 family)|uniref:HAD family hydrolase n=1 Tax=Sphingomonas sp. TaxID=28214 RepID=UPI0035A913DF|nr:HAD family hydrolase [Sphingomonas sp.]
MTLSALIFDVDGTLAETEDLHRRAFNISFTAAGHEWFWDVPLYRELLKVTGGKERIRAFVDQYFSATTLDNDAVTALHRAKTRTYERMVAQEGLHLRPGVMALIDAARSSGLKLAVATTTNLPNVDALCQSVWRQPASAIFDVIAAGDEAPRKKPAPDVYNIALERLGLAPSECIAFEDSRNGVISAKAAGLRVVLTPSQYSAGEDVAQADLLIDDLTKLDFEQLFRGQLKSATADLE